MSAELMKISDFVPGLNFNGEIIRKINYDMNKRTGTDYLFVKTDADETYVLKYPTKGVKRKIQVKIPTYDSKKERKEIIRELYSDGYKQTDIAFFMDISQATVSKALKKDV
jgi:DNA-binding NarL/FixJ family response regulator